MNSDLKVIHCCGSPREMGRQYGEGAREEIRTNCAIWYRDGRPREDFAETTRAVLSSRAPEILDELVGIAEGAGVDEEFIFAANQFDTFCGLQPSPGCTSMAISGGADGPALGKNNDGVGYDTEFIIRISKPADGLPMIQVTYAGWISGLDAMNAEGLINGHNSVGSVFDRPGDRVDIRLWMYNLMRTCRSTGELLNRINDAPLTGKGFNIVLADKVGDVCVVEAAVPLTACCDRGEEFVFATNHYISTQLADSDMRKPLNKKISIYRLGYLEWTMAVSPPKNAKDIADILKSHQPWAPCRHGGPHASSTLWSIIGLPSKAKLLVSSGPPCVNEYSTFTI